MDTSTLSITEAERKSPSALYTTTLTRPPLQPGEWFSQLISPLTHSVVERVERPAESVPPSPRQFQEPFPILPPEIPQAVPSEREGGEGEMSTMLLVFIPLLVIVLTVLLGLVCFLVAVLFMRKRKGIRLTEDGGPLDLSKSDGVIGEGGVEGVESRWLETVDPDVREAYKRAKDWQDQYPPNSVATDITLSQFLSIQEKGVSAWAFEPDYEDNLSLYVQSRTEITFLSDGPGMPTREGGGNSVMANLPLPKLNEVYYWEVKMYEKPTDTEVAIGLATKPYPSFRLPGWNRHSVAYFASDGFKSHNYPFTSSSYGAPLAEGDVLGVGYRPRTGTVFFTRNGRKMDDCYTGLQRLNLFPTIGANGPCTIHVNLGQAGFVFIEANVKKWGLAPMVGTLAPPPAYGSERGSILLDAGYGTPGAGRHAHSGVGALLEAARARSSAAHLGTSAASSSASHPGRPIPNNAPPQSPRSSNSSRRHRRAGKAANLAGSVPVVPSPLRASDGGPGPTTAGSRRRVLGRAHDDEPSYVSPTDTPQISARVPSPDALEYVDDGSEGEDSAYDSTSSHASHSMLLEHNPPTPNLLDISLHSLRNTRDHYFGGRQRREEEQRRVAENEESGSGESDETVRPFLAPPPLGNGDSPPPPGYAPLDPHVYSAGLPADLPEEMINQAIAAMTAADQSAAAV
ncbi:hypothetical protein BCR39DRAFT_553959 [Naematelia encephala]|uniref:B30.2/SPRY domain-containing protein n=1 Tax=Naematelia encephala TaxID=71784 RepID=A0A1Y2AH46_9TREE|nr:hypothetical protein BCR39DRAFT_553959 [Naematelia encephala]